MQSISERNGAALLVALLTVAAVQACGGDDFDSCLAKRNCPPDPASGGVSGAAGSGPATCPGCEAGFCCAGQCVDLSRDPLHCGACGRSCELPAAAAVCSDSTCNIESCNPGFLDCDGDAKTGCERADSGPPSVPRALKPLNAAHTGTAFADKSLRPAFRWEPPERPGSCETPTYDIQVDDSCDRFALAGCTFASPEVNERGIVAASWTPPEALPVNTAVPVGTTYFWRVRACDTDDRCSDWSSPRYLHVGRLVDDLNGDGRSDVVIRSSYDSTASSSDGYILSGADLAIGRHAREIPNSPGAASSLFRFVGDVNGDEYPDVLLNTEPAASLVIVLGGRNLDELQTTSVPVQPGSHATAPLGDWNSDGYSDFAASTWDRAPATVRLFAGGADLRSTTFVDLQPPTGATALKFGRAIEGGLDANDDGLPELAILDSDDKLVHVVHGGTFNEPSVSAAFSVGDECGAGVWIALSRAGDLNADGVDDIAVRCAERFTVYRGSRAEPPSAIWSFTGAAFVDRTNAPPLHFLGGVDFGEDGVDDLLFHDGTTQAAPPGAALRVLSGAKDLGADSVSVGLTLNVPATFFRFGTGLTVGDHDADGRADILAQILTQTYATSFSWYTRANIGIRDPACSQSAASFTAVGNWCEVAQQSFLNSRYGHGLGY